MKDHGVHATGDSFRELRDIRKALERIADTLEEREQA